MAGTDKALGIVPMPGMLSMPAGMLPLPAGIPLPSRLPFTDISIPARIPGILPPADIPTDVEALGKVPEASMLPIADPFPIPGIVPGIVAGIVPVHVLALHVTAPSLCCAA